jgi:hypothetical protein
MSGFSLIVITVVASVVLVGVLSILLDRGASRHDPGADS